MKVFLVGFMACGKTKWGKKLAQHRDIPFVDLDHLIEESIGTTVANYFADNGEQKFRELERDTLKNTAFAENSIISCGGGTPCFFDNMEWLNQHGKTVYIRVAPEILTYRILHAKVERPLAKGKTEEELLAFVKQTLEHRKQYYEQAHIIIDNPEPSIDILEQAIFNTQELRF